MRLDFSTGSLEAYENALGRPCKKRQREATGCFSLSLRGVILFSLAHRQAQKAREVVGNPRSA